MREHFPSLRLLSLPSEDGDMDWRVLAQQIDKMIASSGMDLAEEMVYLQFQGLPGSYLGGSGNCRVGRSVIGRIQPFQEPFELTDHKASFIHRSDLKSQVWSEIFEETFKVWEDLARKLTILKPAFTFRVKRMLDPDLDLKVEAIFFE